MQPQDGGSFDLWHAASALGGAVFGALSAVGAWVYRAGGMIPSLRKEFTESIIAAEKRVEMKIDEGEKRSEEKIDQMADNFRESFSGMRQKINDVELEAVRLFVAKPDFDDFRKEYREDMRDLKKNIAEMLRSKQ